MLVFRTFNFRGLRFSLDVSDGEALLSHYVSRESVFRWKDKSSGLDRDKPGRPGCHLWPAAA